MPGRVWYFDPNAGGITIPETVRRDVTSRIEKVANDNYKGKYTRLDIRFRGCFCYIDAYQEHEVHDLPLSKDWPETLEEYAERLRNTPVHLCRLRYFGNDEWSFCFYTYSNERYELTVYPNGNFFGKPEGAFLISAVYLQ